MNEKLTAILGDAPTLTSGVAGGSFPPLASRLSTGTV